MAEPIRSPLQVADIRTVGFVGMTQKGPIDVPTRINNWDEFLETYGYTSEHYLSDSVEAFFRNGGVRCYVVRIAHAARDGKHPEMDNAACAERVILDDWNKPALRFTARSEGRWGNNIWVGLEHRTGATALLTRDLDVGAGFAEISTSRGFEVGALVRIYDRDNEDYVILTEVNERTLRWSIDTPINRRHRAAAPTKLEVVEFDIQVALRDRREVFKGLQLSPLSRKYAPRVIESSSRLVNVEVLENKSPLQHSLPNAEALAKIVGGRDGTEAVTPEDFIGYDHGPAERAGLLGLVEVEDVAVLAIPDAMTFVDRKPGPEGEMKAQRIQDAMVDLCENLKDRFAILDCPRTRDVEHVKRWRRRIDSSYCAFYWPWVAMPAAEGATRELPPSGLMAGLYNLRDTESGPHHAPANGPILGAVDLSVRVTEDHLGMLNAEGINSFRISRGIRPWGARTASSDPDWRYINVRRLFIMLRRSLETGMAWVPFEPNTEKTWGTVEDMVRAFLSKLFQRGMFAGGNPEDSFFVKCDEETNPSEVVSKGQLVCDVGVAPVSPAEFIMIQVVQDLGGGTEE